MRTLLAAVLFTALFALVALTGADGRAQDARKKWPKPEWVDPNHGEPNGTKYRTFTSRVLGAEVSYLVYLPPGYERETKRYPVIYWLHGLGGSQRGGATVFVPQLDAAIRQGSLQPVIAVSVNGMVNSFYCDWINGKRPMESVIIKDLLAHVDETYRTIPRREARVVQGFSMGGYGSAHLAFKYPDQFGTVVVDAGALVSEASARKGPKVADFFTDIFGDGKDRYVAEHPNTLAVKNADQIRGRMNVRLGVGKDDGLLRRVQETHELLDRLKIEHQFEALPGVAHNSSDYYQKLGVKGFELHRKAFESLAGDK
jgi:endo-1,4-beta-xylanase